MPEQACWHCGGVMQAQSDGRLACPSCGWWVPSSRICGRCGDIMHPDPEEPDQLYCLRCGAQDATRVTSREVQAVWREEVARAKGAPRRSGGRRRKYGRKPVRMLPWYRRWGQGS